MLQQLSSLCESESIVMSGGLHRFHSVEWWRSRHRSKQDDNVACADVCMLYGLRSHLHKIQTQCEPDYLPHSCSMNQSSAHVRQSLCHSVNNRPIISLCTRMCMFKFCRHKCHFAREWHIVCMKRYKCYRTERRGEIDINKKREEKQRERERERKGGRERERGRKIRAISPIYLTLILLDIIIFGGDLFISFILYFSLIFNHNFGSALFCQSCGLLASLDSVLLFLILFLTHCMGRQTSAFTSAFISFLFSSSSGLKILPSTNRSTDGPDLTRPRATV